MLHLRERLARVGRAARPVPLTRRELFALPPLGGYRLTESWRRHRDGGGTRKTFVPGVPLNANNAWNYFWARGQQPTPL